MKKKRTLTPGEKVERVLLCELKNVAKAHPELNMPPRMFVYIVERQVQQLKSAYPFMLEALRNTQSETESIIPKFYDYSSWADKQAQDVLLKVQHKKQQD